MKKAIDSETSGTPYTPEEIRMSHVSFSSICGHEVIQRQKELIIQIK